MTVAHRSSTLVQIRPMLRRAVERIIAIDGENNTIATEDATSADPTQTCSARQAQKTSVACVADMIEVCEEIWLANDALPVSANRRLARLKHLLMQQLNGNTVRLRELRAALTGSQFAYFQDHVNALTFDEKVFGEGMPEALKPYQRLLKCADLQYQQLGKAAAAVSESFHTELNSLTDSQHEPKTSYAHALSNLEAAVNLASGPDLVRLHSWLDRPVMFGKNGNLRASKFGVPRVRGSRSVFAQDAGLPKLSKRLKREQHVLEILLMAIVGTMFDAEILEVLN